ncbi:uncharacterized protein LOC143287402 [Babylonia areolata]|uniref:uncharacterized protein LOC143287402 n=1 Tax=Babylonia areolata TaxID=304850 RepID=UPI003FD39544
MDTVLCLLLLVFVAGVMTSVMTAGERGTAGCTSRSIATNLRICHRNVSDSLRSNFNKTECTNTVGYNECLCRALGESIHCFIDVWLACFHDGALSDLHLSHEHLSHEHLSYEHFMDYMFFSAVGDRCPADWFGVLRTSPHPVTWFCCSG